MGSYRKGPFRVLGLLLREDALQVRGVLRVPHPPVLRAAKDAFLGEVGG